MAILPAFQTPKNKSTNAYPLGQELDRSIALVQQLVKGACCQGTHGGAAGRVRGRRAPCTLPRVHGGHARVARHMRARCLPTRRVLVARLRAACAGDKASIQKAVQRGDIIKFASQQFAVGHRRTNFARWFESPVGYQVDFVPQFEPWYVVDRLHTPFYDANFRGYGRNKQQQVRGGDLPFWFWGGGGEASPGGVCRCLLLRAARSPAPHDAALRRRRTPTLWA